MRDFQPSDYGPTFAALLTTDRARPLGPGNARPPAELQNLSLREAFAPAEIVDQQMAELCLAALWLLYDDLDRSHSISQRVETAEGSYWHAIMHRRELDYGNSKYWFRQVGAHPIFADLDSAARELSAADKTLNRELAASSTWDPFRFVDLCQAAAQNRTPAEALLRQIAQREWELLFDYCYRRALSREGEMMRGERN